MSDDGPSAPLLAVEDVSVNFGAVQALSSVSLDVRRGEIVAIIGPNGAGKTTLLNVISGFYHADRKSTRLNSSHIQKSRMPSSA